MAKRKKFKLNKLQKTYSPVVAIMGGKHHTDYMPATFDLEGEITLESEKIKGNSKIIRRRTKKGIFSKNISK
jgi:hypothetical protein